MFSWAQIMWTITPCYTNKQGLQLLENQFGLGICGRHDETTIAINANHHIIVRTQKLASSVSLNEISIEPVDELQLDQFFAFDETGVHCNLQCIKCMCQACPTSNCINLKKEGELVLIEKLLVYSAEQKHWIVTYPWIKD